MNIIKYRPTTSLLDWDFDSVLDNFFGDDFWGVERHHYPTVDVKEEDGKYVLEADLPGLTEKDLNVEVKDNLLTISSKKSETKEEKKKGYLVKERRDFSFSRSFVLPNDADKEKIEANFKNGVLTLAITRNPAAQPKQIEVKSN